MSIRPATKSGSEPIPGYTLRKRLGAGGYGEVWLADAPGGLQKAVKLIYGTLDQSHATSELRSLQRIRQVYHPFLLSIERIEIVDSQVIIVTELAESSLLDRFEQCRRKGAPGIERSQLLDFMRDAADALDFLSQKHALQHLDIKPGNLLVIADRIKVGDFGLIKDLHDQNQSLVSGLTPTYSAPEIFDGRPDYRSDQYSLAIVYMEMLAGQVPFNGKSTGELARQHLTQQPDLDSLPPADRPVVARALSKNPLDRFGTCRLFIEQLLKTRGAVLPASQFRSDSTVEQESVEALTRIEDRKTSTASSLSDQHVLQPAIDMRSMASRWNNPRAMFIGLGGLGGQALSRIRQLAKLDCDNRLDMDDHAWSVIDTDAESLNSLTSDEQEHCLPSQVAFELRIFHPSEYRDANPELFCPLSRRWLYNIPRSQKTEGVRPLAILSLLDHYGPLRNRMSKDLADLIQKHEADADCQEPLRIYLLSSLHGGTGSALLGELGLMIRRIMSERGFSNYRLCAIASAATTANNSNANLHSAAAIATLSELTYLMDRDNEVAPLHFGDKLHAASSHKPFDWVTLVEGGMHGMKSDADKAAAELASVAWIDAQSALGSAMAEARLEASQQAAESNAWLRSADYVSLSVSANVTAARLARWCCEQTLTLALQAFAGPRGLATSCTRSPEPVSSNLATASGDFPLTLQASEDFSNRFMAELGLSTNDSPNQAESATLGDPANAQHRWARRIAEDSDVVRLQLLEDLVTWKDTIAKIVKLRIYNWKQIEQIQLHTIEAIIGFYERQASQIAEDLRPTNSHRRSTDELSNAVRDYLKVFSEKCLEQLQEFQRGGRTLARKVRSWCDSIGAEKALNETSWDVNLSGLPPKLQLLANRVSAVLESTIHRMAAQQVGLEKVSRQRDQADILLSDSSFNLKTILSLSTDLTSRLSGEMGITPEELNGSQETDEPMLSFKQIDKYFPAITQSASQLHRFVITPVEQEQVALRALKREKLDGKTTLIAARRSLDSCLLCEGGRLKLYQLVSSLWRPCPKTLQLAERLRTRIDVEWYPATRLLDVTQEEDVHLQVAAAAPASLPLSNVAVSSLPVASSGTPAL
ncbi:MAG: protein kinase [Pirellulaceae bacterium]